MNENNGSSVLNVLSHPILKTDTKFESNDFRFVMSRRFLPQLTFEQMQEVLAERIFSTPFKEICDVQEESVFVVRNDAVYFGQFCNDKENGFGIVVENTGEVLEGNFVNGVLSGLGRYTTPSGDWLYSQNMVHKSVGEYRKFGTICTKRYIFSGQLKTDQVGQKEVVFPGAGCVFEFDTETAGYTDVRKTMFRDLDIHFEWLTSWHTSQADFDFSLMHAPQKCFEKVVELNRQRHVEYEKALKKIKFLDDDEEDDSDGNDGFLE